MKISTEELGEHPRIWYRIPGYVIRNHSPDLEESVLHHMTTYFLNEEPFCSSCKVTSDQLSLHEATEWWRGMLKQNLAVIALPEGSPGADLKPITQPLIPLAGVNVLLLGRKDDPPAKPIEEQFQGTAVRRALTPYAKISKMVDCFSRYGVDTYMDAAGLSVHPDFRGRGLGAALLEARLALCRELGIRVTKTVFTAISSQKVAMKCKFESIADILYGDIKEKDGTLTFPNIPTTNKVMLTVKTIDTD